MEEYLKKVNFDRISKVTINGKNLIIVFEKNIKYPGLYLYGYNSDEEIRTVIKENLDKAYKTAVQKIDDNNFLLNIVSKENYCNFPHTFNNDEKGLPHDLLIRQLDIYMPIIRKFILDN